MTLRQIEQFAILAAIRRHRTQKAAAKALGISVRKLGMRVREYREARR